MSIPGRKPKPALQVVREGNPGHRPVNEGVRFAPTDPVEPDWELHLPGEGDEDVLVREQAAQAWARVVPMLVVAAGLTDTQRDTALEYCVTWARLVQAERHLSAEGLVVGTERGNVKNPWTTIAHQYRAHFRSLVGELGLSPAAATRLTPPEGGDDDDGVFD